MHNIILIAENMPNEDLNGLPVIEYQNGPDIPPLPENAKTVETVETVETPAQNHSEMSFVLQKLFLSFGALLICIAIFIVLAYFFKRKVSPNDEVYTEEAPSQPEEDFEDEIPSVLNTPGNINKCIRTFLENTRNI